MASKTTRSSRPQRHHLITQSPHYPLVITIDGPGGVGKSTVAKLLAKRLGVMYLDTGATYRALAFAALERHLISDVPRLSAFARQLPLQLHGMADGSLQVLLDGRDVSREIRAERISEAAAQISQYPKVREAMVSLQRSLANAHGVVVEGRDTGSVVFPKATHKFFLDADPAIRAQRRQRELMKRYGSRSSLRLVQEQLQFRDELDRSRRVGPLVKPKGAIAIDTSRVSAAQVVRSMLRRIRPAPPLRPPRP